MRAKGIFVTGTDTGVGKTMVSAALVMVLSRRMYDIGYHKPVASDGIMHQGRLANEDALFVKKVAGLQDALDQINPLCLPLPLSPLAAARQAGVEISYPLIVKAGQEAMQRHQFTVMEGAGGLLVPLSPGRTMLDLMVDIDLPVLLVGRPGLGTINHTLLSIQALKARGLKVAGFCFSSPESQVADDPSIAQNARLICEFCGERFWGTLPCLALDSTGACDPEKLTQAADTGLELDAILEIMD